MTRSKLVAALQLRLHDITTKLDALEEEADRIYTNLERVMATRIDASIVPG